MSNANILIVEDDTDLREALVETIELAGHQSFSAENGKVALGMLEAVDPVMVVTDVQMDCMDGNQLLKELQRRAPGTPVILITAHGNVNDAVTAMRAGAVDYLTKPFEPAVLLDKIKRYMPKYVGDENAPVAEDPKSKQLLTLAERVAKTDATVMISGESGTGKEVLAKLIHDHSARSDGPFIAINCAAIPENMLEATLFGYEKGAFTGAVKAMPGKFEQAQGGTLLLDEISEMDLALQAKILRVLQEKEVERLGSRKIIDLDVRVLATSNREMKDEVKAGRFREDLFYRLNVFPLHWFPLRERPKDILPLAEYLLKKHCKEASLLPVPTFSKGAENYLSAYAWPGNAREMDNVIQRALILKTGDTIEADDLHLDLTQKITVPAPSNEPSDLKTQEFEHIATTLSDNNNNRKVVAENLGISERTLRYKLAKMREQGFEV